MSVNDFVVLETLDSPDGTQKGLLFDPHDHEQPYAVAYDFDRESMTWSDISHEYTIEEALAEFKQLRDPRWLIRGLTPQDIESAWGEEFAITHDDAQEIAQAANEQTEEYLSAETEDVRRLVEDICPRIEDNITRERDVSESHEQTLVGGTMYLDVNGYDYVSARDTEQGRAVSSGRPFESSERFVTFSYSMSLVEEEMAKEGIPLTQPNIAFMSDKIAKALHADAQENAGYIASDTVVYWKSSCPDQAQRQSPSQVADHARAVAHASAEDRDQAAVQSARQAR